MRSARTSLISWIHAGIAAFQFLTRLPVPVQIEYTEEVFRRSAVFYPLVGGVLGVLLAAAGHLLPQLLPLAPAAVLLAGLWVALTGALHLDGLMDTADGVLSHRSRERMLEIMKDSRVGAMGVIVCVLHLLLKGALLFSLLGGQRDRALWLLPLVPLWSRWLMTVAIAGWPYARQGEGLGTFFRGVGFRHVACGAAMALLLSAGCWLGYGWPAGAESCLPDSAAGHPVGSGLFSNAAIPCGAWPELVRPALLPLVAASCGCGLAAYFHRKLGGLTGDTYGAINELTESAMLLILVIQFT